MATWNEADWHDEADGDIAQESARVAAQNSSLECDIDVSVTVARSNYTAAAKSSGPFVDVPSEKSGLSLECVCSDTLPASEDSLLDGDLDKDFPPGDGVLIPGLSDVSLSPKHTITADPLDMLPDSSEPHFRISEQSLAESAVLHPEMSDISLKEDKATSTAEVIIIEDLPVRPKSPYQTRNRPQISAQRQLSPFSSPEKLAPPPAESRPMPPPLSQRNQLGARRKAATVSAEVPNSRSVGAEAAPPVMAKGSVANQFLEKIGQLRGAAVLSEGCHDTYTLAEDLMSIEGAQNQPDKYKKEDFGELFTKKSLNAAQFAPKLQSQTETEAESEDEESSLDFDHLPIRRRMDIWKRREDRAIRKGLILIPKVGKQGRFPISAAGL
ncbi:uncharacterized protein LOC119436557 isoform X3 [Dermacentor silvarum]|uniref:uncharacterized protein LOC119436557 isoform X3 n=1 Tax=Dermacentor silvarum TaxID=543639 RepID=UPI0021011E94|nr:uncharacterized protein LOC119436557 isoform X3 [Dermacentor silvarum]